MYYKLTDQNLRTHEEFQWEVGKWVLAHGSGLKELCTDGWLHCYDDPILAILLNPIHANIKNPRLWLVDVGGFAKYDKGLKCGFRAMRLVREISLPTITMEQKVKIAIFCAKSVYKDKKWNEWADKWLSGEDRSKDAAHVAADAADAAHVQSYAVAAHAAAHAANAANAATDAAGYAADDAADAVADAVYAAHNAYATAYIVAYAATDAAACAATHAADAADAADAVAAAAAHAYATVYTAVTHAYAAADAAACAATHAADAAADAGAIDLKAIVQQALA